MVEFAIASLIVLYHETWYLSFIVFVIIIIIIIIIIVIIIIIIILYLLDFYGTLIVSIN